MLLTVGGYNILFPCRSQLEDGHTIFDYDVGLNDIIQLMIRPVPTQSPPPSPLKSNGIPNGTENGDTENGDIQNGNGATQNGNGDIQNGNGDIQNGNGTAQNGTDPLQNGSGGSEDGDELMELVSI